MQVRFSTTQPMGAAALDRCWTCNHGGCSPHPEQSGVLLQKRGVGGSTITTWTGSAILRNRLQRNQRRLIAINFLKTFHYAVDNLPHHYPYCIQSHLFFNVLPWRLVPEKVMTLMSFVRPGKPFFQTPLLSSGGGGRNTWRPHRLTSIKFSPFSVLITTPLGGCCSINTSYISGSSRAPWETRAPLNQTHTAVPLCCKL